jgi:hypothetical protein
VAADGRLNTVSTSVVACGELSLVTKRRSVIWLVLKLPVAAGGYTCRRCCMLFTT